MHFIHTCTARYRVCVYVCVRAGRVCTKRCEYKSDPRYARPQPYFAQQHITLGETGGRACATVLAVGGPGERATRPPLRNTRA